MENSYKQKKIIIFFLFCCSGLLQFIKPPFQKKAVSCWRDDEGATITLFWTKKMFVALGGAVGKKKKVRLCLAYKESTKASYFLLIV